jgi:hypothetical protein
MVEHVHHADCFLGSVAEHPLEGRACVPQSTVWVHYLEDIRGVLHHRPQPAVVFPELLIVMSGLVGTTMRDTFTEVVPVSIRGVHVFLLAAVPTTGVKYTARSW